MKKSKGKIFFNIIIAICIIAVIGILGYLAFDYIYNYFVTKEAAAAVETFENTIVVAIDDEENIQEEQPNQQEPVAQNTTKKTSTVSYKNYNMVGSIQIPKTKVKYPIVDKITTKSMTVAVAILYGPGLNEIGNTVLVAHNYRNGTFFSNNKKLVEGDKVYVTDGTGTKIEYTIYNTYTTSDKDFAYATRNTNGKREISLSTCTSDASKRLVIWAKES